MGKPTGFLEYEREENKIVPPEDRLKSFKEFHAPLSSTDRILEERIQEERQRQGARCMDCGVPLCQSAMELAGMVTGCPLHNLIPEWNHEIYRGHMPQALARLLKTNNFPEFTGRVCPALCEKACILGQDDEPVTSHDNELYIIETAWLEGFMKPRIPAVRSGKKIAVVGSGPSGLAAADQLNHRGHSVTVFERDDQIGGLLMYGIPNMKLDKSVILRRRELMEQEGVRFRTGMDVGRNITAEDLQKEFDAVILCCGAKAPRSLPCLEGKTISGVRYAVDFLKETTQTVLSAGDYTSEYCRSQSTPEETGTELTDTIKNRSGITDRERTDSSKSKSESPGRERTDSSKSENEIPDRERTDSFKKECGFPAKELAGPGAVTAKGKHVVIVGGGDTGNDCIATVLRQGCRSVTALEMMPEPPAERAPSNPWPQWPKILKTDYGHEEAAFVFGHDPRIFKTTVKECITDKRGNLKKIRTMRGNFDKGIWVEEPDSEQLLPCDLLLIAAGFTGCEPYTAEAFSAPRTGRGTVQTAPGSYATSVPGVFTAGDMHRGQSLVVWAIAEGRACAAEVDRYLMGYTFL